ncbi:hypothetical protein CCMSSC00406_0009238 [Pleurotus cornucopiae]|uniref:Uncharacterized protein n=1 Tax=Pleurotus cornucopiae TaxID=5321 RepID=A0ACB7IZJ7_PLECO|nr:hypothetical protein CCMSSC00406_0009238 [Pleurotus cornucopiae]
MDRGSMNGFSERAEREIRGPVSFPQIRERVDGFPLPPRHESFAPQDARVPSRARTTKSDTFVYQHRLLEPTDILLDEETTSESEETTYDGSAWLPPRSRSRYPTSSVRTGSAPDEDVSYERAVEARMREVFANEVILVPGSISKPRSFSDSANLFTLASMQSRFAHPLAIASSMTGPSTQSRDIRDTVGKVTWSTGRSANAVQQYSASKEDASLLLLLGGGHHKDVLMEGRDDLAEKGQTIEAATEGVVAEEARPMKGLPKAAKGKGKAREVKPRSVATQKAAIEKTDDKRPAAQIVKGKGKAKDTQKPAAAKKIQAAKVKAQPKTNKRKASSMSVSVPILEEAPPAKKVRFESETSAGSQDGPRLFISLPSKARLEEMLGRQPVWEVVSASSSATLGNSSPPGKTPRNTASRSTRKH